MVPSPYVWAANSKNMNKHSGWTWKGKDISFLKVVGGLSPVYDSNNFLSYANRPSFESGLEAISRSDKARIKIENINGPVLLIGAEDDQLWPSCRFSEIAMEILNKSKRSFKDKMICYKNSGHDILIPGYSTRSRVSYNSEFKYYIALGGTPQGTGNARTHAWKEILEFLSRF